MGKSLCRYPVWARTRTDSTAPLLLSPYHFGTWLPNAQTILIFFFGKIISRFFPGEPMMRSSLLPTVSAIATKVAHIVS